MNIWSGIYARGRGVAVHSRHPAGAFATQKEHRPEHKPAREEAYVANLLTKAKQIGPQALYWAQAACSERGVRAYRLIQENVVLNSLTTARQSELGVWSGPSKPPFPLQNLTPPGGERKHCTTVTVYSES